MHGLLFAELKKYVVTKLGPEAWNKLLTEAGLESKIYLPNQVYTDDELVKLVTTASALTGQPAAAILEDFGTFIAPDLYNMYKAQLNPAWKTLDLIENTEEIVHRTVRLKVPGAKPPMLRTLRKGPDEVVIVYNSPRRLCAVARGIAKGVAHHFGERVDVTDVKCMHEGDPNCEISVKLA